MEGRPVTHEEFTEAPTRQKREILESVQELVRDSQTEILRLVQSDDDFVREATRRILERSEW